MYTNGITPILNVSNIQQSFQWFEKLGWEKGWEWGKPVDFGCVCSGQCEYFSAKMDKVVEEEDTSNQRSETTEKKQQIREYGCQCGWITSMKSMTLRSARHRDTWKPMDMPWNVREMHIR